MKPKRKTALKKKIQVTISGETREIVADQMKLARTMFNKSGSKYTQKQMWKMGFKRKGDKEESVYNQLMRTNPDKAKQLKKTWDDALKFANELK